MFKKYKYNNRYDYQVGTTNTAFKCIVKYSLTYLFLHLGQRPNKMRQISNYTQTQPNQQSRVGTESIARYALRKGYGYGNELRGSTRGYEQEQSFLIISGIYYLFIVLMAFHSFIDSYVK